MEILHHTNVQRKRVGVFCSLSVDFILKFQSIHWIEMWVYSTTEFHLASRDKSMQCLYFGMRSFCLSQPSLVFKQVYFHTQVSPSADLTRRIKKHNSFHSNNRGGGKSEVWICTLSILPAVYPLSSSKAKAAGSELPCSRTNWMQIQWEGRTILSSITGFPFNKVYQSSD